MLDGSGANNQIKIASTTKVIDENKNASSTSFFRYNLIYINWYKIVINNIVAVMTVKHCVMGSESTFVEFALFLDFLGVFCYISSVNFERVCRPNQMTQRLEIWYMGSLYDHQLILKIFFSIFLKQLPVLWQKLKLLQR